MGGHPNLPDSPHFGRRQRSRSHRGILCVARLSSSRTAGASLITITWSGRPAVATSTDRNELLHGGEVALEHSRLGHKPKGVTRPRAISSLDRLDGRVVVDSLEE